MRDLLDRFRPSGAPGAATAAGVPSDRWEAASAELEPVFAALADVAAECGRLRREAAAVAARREAEAGEKARSLVARARADAEAERAAEATRLRARAAAEATRMQRQAQAEADGVRRRAEQRRAELVDKVVDRVRTQLTKAVP